mmetsp:Transcript_7419/g.17912  ORF Transcript_7419/g.17912 Transcript_7419/m.17912 type:complete len:234 (+) Transcript_7419:243-944(+)
MLAAEPGGPRQGAGLRRRGREGAPPEPQQRAGELRLVRRVLSIGRQPPARPAPARPGLVLGVRRVPAALAFGAAAAGDAGVPVDEDFDGGAHDGPERVLEVHGPDLLHARPDAAGGEGAESGAGAAEGCNSVRNEQRGGGGDPGAAQGVRQRNGLLRKLPRGAAQHTGRVVPTSVGAAPPRARGRGAGESREKNPERRDEGKNRGTPKNHDARRARATQRRRRTAARRAGGNG